MQSGQCLTIGVWRGMCNASQFLNLYLGEFQGNGVQSYRRVFPRAKYQSAKASASRFTIHFSLLQSPCIYPLRFSMVSKGFKQTANHSYSKINRYLFSFCFLPNFFKRSTRPSNSDHVVSKYITSLYCLGLFDTKTY